MTRQDLIDAIHKVRRPGATRCECDECPKVADLVWPLVETLLVYIDWYGGWPLHDDGCPEDDTCACVAAQKFAKAWAALGESVLALGAFDPDVDAKARAEDIGE